MDTSGIGIYRPPTSTKAAPIAIQKAAEPVANAISFGFSDLIDIVNPLQHIPGVSSVYRAVTGDEIGSIANVIGSTLFGGPIGGGMALANEIIEDQSGKNIGGHITSAILGDDTASPEKAAFAANSYENTEKLANSGRSTTRDWIYAGTHLA